MKAATLTSPQEVWKRPLRVGEVARPEPKPGQVLLRVRAMTRTWSRTKIGVSMLTKSATPVGFCVCATVIALMSNDANGNRKRISHPAQSAIENLAGRLQFYISVFSARLAGLGGRVERPESPSRHVAPPRHPAEPSTPGG